MEPRCYSLVIRGQSSGASLVVHDFNVENVGLRQVSIHEYLSEPSQFTSYYFNVCHHVPHNKVLEATLTLYVYPS